MTGEARSTVTCHLTASDLVAAIPQLQESANISTKTLITKPSASLNWDDLRLCYQTIHAAFAAGTDGVVILQGTDTLEDCAYFFDLICKTDHPIVFSGAMRAVTAPGADGPANLLAAVRVAASEAAAKLGVLVVLNDYIHCARYVTKTHTSKLDAFVSPLCGPLGLITENQPLFCYQPFRATDHYQLPDGTPPQVSVFRYSFGQHWDFAAMEKHAAVVISAAGGGHVAGEDVAPFAELAKKIPVILASRTGNGVVLTNSYAYPGSELELINAGLIPAGALNPTKARILTLLVLWNKLAITPEIF